MIRSIPNINTARLTLCAMRPEDFDRFAQIWAMSEVVRHLGGSPWTRGKAWEWFLRNAGHWQMTGFGQWAVVDQRSRTIIGHTGFFYGARNLGEDFDPFPEAACLLVPKAQDAGMGHEATQAAHDWFDRVIPGRLVAKVALSNAAALRVAERLGYRPLRQVEHQGAPSLLLSRNGPPRSG